MNTNGLSSHILEIVGKNNEKVSLSHIRLGDWLDLVDRGSVLIHQIRRARQGGAWVLYDEVQRRLRVGNVHEYRLVNSS